MTIDAQPLVNRDAKADTAAKHAPSALRQALAGLARVARLPPPAFSLNSVGLNPNGKASSSLLEIGSSPRPVSNGAGSGSHSSSRAEQIARETLRRWRHVETRRWLGRWRAHASWLRLQARVDVARAHAADTHARLRSYRLAVTRWGLLTRFATCQRVLARGSLQRAFTGWRGARVVAAHRGHVAGERRRSAFLAWRFVTVRRRVLTAKGQMLFETVATRRLRALLADWRVAAVCARGQRVALQRAVLRAWRDYTVAKRAHMGALRAFAQSIRTRALRVTVATWTRLAPSRRRLALAGAHATRAQLQRAVGTWRVWVGARAVVRVYQHRRAEATLRTALQVRSHDSITLLLETAGRARAAEL